MKKSSLRDALVKGRQADPEPKAETPAAKQTGEKPKRFHTTVYLDKEFYNKIKIALITEGEDRDFNRLVNDLLKEWHEIHGE